MLEVDVGKELRWSELMTVIKYWRLRILTAAVVIVVMIVNSLSALQVLGEVEVLAHGKLDGSLFSASGFRGRVILKLSFHPADVGAEPT